MTVTLAVAELVAVGDGVAEDHDAVEVGGGSEAQRWCR